MNLRDWLQSQCHGVIPKEAEEQLRILMDLADKIKVRRQQNTDQVGTKEQTERDLRDAKKLYGYDSK